MPNSISIKPVRRAERPKWSRRLALASLTLLLAACQTNPLGMSDEEWARLTPEQQMEARMKQAEINKANAERRAAAAKRRAEQAAAERARIEAIYASARYGDVVECVVEGGVADFKPGWKRYDPSPFTLVRGESKSISIRGGKGSRKFWAQLSPDGLEVSLCSRSGRSHSSRYCTSFSARSAEYSYGISRPVSIDDMFRSARLACTYRPGPGMPQRVIQQRNVEVHRVIHVYHHGRRPPPRRVTIEHHYDHGQPAQPVVRERVVRERVIVVPSRRDHAHPVTRRVVEPTERRARREEAVPRRYERPYRAEPRREAPEEVERYEYTPTSVPDDRHDDPRSHRVPPASDRAREVAAPNSAVQSDNAADCEDEHPSRGRGRARGRGARSVCR